MKPKKEHHPIRSFIWGAALIIIGTVATVATYSMTANGGRFSVWYGAVIVGIIRVVASIIQAGQRPPKEVNPTGSQNAAPADLPTSYYAQYTTPPAAQQTGPIRPAYVLPSQQQNGGNTGLVLGLSAIAVVLGLIAGFSFYNVLTGGNMFQTVAQVTGINKVTPPDEKHTNVSTDRPYYATGDANIIPVKLVLQGYENMGNGIALQPESVTDGECMVYDGCFRYDYTQFNATCTKGVAITVEGFLGATDLGPLTQQVGPMYASANQTGAIELEGKFNGQYADTVALKSVACA